MRESHRITPDDVLTLLRRSTPAGVLSVCVGLSNSARHDAGHWLATVRSGLREMAQKRPGDRGLAALIDTAQTEISEIPRELRHRSLVYFRSLDPDWVWWRSLQLHVPDLFAFHPSPQVRHLIALLDEAPILGIAVVSQERTRILTWKEGVTEEAEEIRFEDESEAKALAAVAAGAGPTRTGMSKNRAADRTRRRLIFMAQKIGDLASRHSWQRLLLIGPSSTIGAISGALPDARRRQLIDPIGRNLINAPASEIAATAARRLHDWKRRVELLEVESVIEEANSGARARTGIDSCLEHINERRVERLFVCGDLELRGFRDPAGRLHLRAPRLGSGDSLLPETRLVENMVITALESGARVTPLEGESARRMYEVGGVGVRLRWSDPVSEGNGSRPGS